VQTRQERPVPSLDGARVLVLTSALPMPFGGADARWQHVLVNGLPKFGADVTCVAVSPDSAETVEQAQANAEAGGWRLVFVPKDIPRSLRRRVATLVRPQSHLRYATGLLDTLRSLDVSSYDVVHVEHLFTAHALDDFRRAVVNLHFLDVLDWEGRDHMSAWERVYYLQAKRATPSMLRKTPRLTASTDRVADAAVRLGARARPLVVPLSLDTSLYVPVPRVTDPVVGVIGSMDWYPSRAAAIRVLTTVWPRIRAARPDARLVVAGRNSQQFLGEHFPVDGAELIGEVDHPRDFFGQVSVLLYPPPRGSGVKIKVLEALAYGVPVVTNAEGYEGVSCTDCVVPAETDDEFVAGVLAVLNDPARSNGIVERGRAYLEQEYSAGVGVERLVAAYRSFGLIS
jgi:glycosyltransferase involved in cell wall biosynthesis